MKVFFAQWKRDIISLRALLWVWAVCVIAIVAVSYGSRLPVFHQPAAPQGDPKEFLLYQVFPVISLVMLGLLFLAVQALLLLLLISGLVQADPLTEPDAFWRTRPIPRLVLLGEKLAFVLFLTAGSILAASMVNVGNLSAGPLVLHGAVFAIGLMAFAAVTSNFFQIIVALLGLALAPKILAAIILAFTHSMLSRPEGTLSVGDHPASVWISVFSLACFLAVIFCQYLTSKTMLCRALLFATFFITTLWQGR